MEDGAEHVAPASWPKVPGFELLRVIGRGGMGIVWEAVEQRFDRRVALKVHRHRTADGADTLLAEALVAARIDDPGIVRVLDVGRTLDGRPYYVMDLVEGTDLARVLADGPIPSARAVAIAMDIARAAAAAHDCGVIHRDLKPANVILDKTERARVLDFGIALDLRSEDPYAGKLAGSPSYMAPEQVRGATLCPQTDVYAIGVILHEMLVGRKPFVGRDIPELLEAIATAEPPPPSSQNPALHVDLDAVVARCLAKSPSDRFPSARALLATLLAVAEGRPIAVAVGAEGRASPRRSSTVPHRPRRAEAQRTLAWKWHLASSPRELWPYVANTDRFNKAVGLPAVAFVDAPKEDGSVERTGDMHVLGVQVRWRESPFEWVKERSHSVFRSYRSGPLTTLWNCVTLRPLEGGGTELVHEVSLTPRGLLGRAAAFAEFDRKLASGTDRFYRHLDRLISSGSSEDPFEVPWTPTEEQRAAVAQACATLRADGASPRQAELLEGYLLNAPDRALVSIRPYALADAWNENRDEVMDLFVYAAALGLLEPAWDVVCPQCAIAHESLPSLSQLRREGTCKACASTFERDLRDTVELVFVASPRVRRVERATYCAGAPALRPHILAQQVLEPGERRTLSLELPRGSYRLATSVSRQRAELTASAVGFEPRSLAIGSASRVELHPPVVRAGVVELVLENDSDVEETFRVEVAGSRADSIPAVFALTHMPFREHFPREILPQREHLRVSRLAFLFVSVREHASLFDGADDAEALEQLTAIDDRVRELAREHDGSVVPSSVDTLVLAFPTALKAFGAALALHAALQTHPLARALGIALHEGRCIALTRDGKPEFFGEPLHRGQALVRECPDGGIVLSPVLAADRAIALARESAGLRETVSTSTVAPYAGRRITILRSPEEPTRPARPSFVTSP
jgi:serine/threonine protein kinase